MLGKEVGTEMKKFSTVGCTTDQQFCSGNWLGVTSTPEKSWLFYICFAHMAG